MLTTPDPKSTEANKTKIKVIQWCVCNHSRRWHIKGKCEGLILDEYEGFIPICQCNKYEYKKTEIMYIQVN